MAPLFSVITVTLNCADAAVETAKTVLAQSFPSVEYIVKDGGSTDGTVERLRELGVTVHVSPDRGIYDAMAQGLELSIGEYIYYLNAGDTFASPTALAEFAERLDRSAAVAYAELMLLPMRNRDRQPAQLSRYYLFRRNMNHQSWMMRRDVYQRLGFNLEYAFCADQELIWRAFLQQGLRFQHIDMVLANFVYGGASTTLRNRRKVDAERWRLLQTFYSPAEILFYGLRSLYFLNPLKVRIRRVQNALRGVSYS